MKAINNYKKALKHAKSDKDKARVFILIGQAHMCLAPRLFERDQRGKAISKACFYIKQCMEITPDFDSKVKKDLEDQLKFLMVRQIMERADDTSQLVMVVELIY